MGVGDGEDAAPEGCASGRRLARMACSRAASHTGVPQGWPSVARPAMDGHVLAGKVLPVLKLGMNTGWRNVNKRNRG
jgi:hypothetical protein